MVELKQRATRDFITICSDDTFPEELWRLLAIIRYVANGEDDLLADADVTDPSMVRRLALEIVQDLLTAGTLLAWFTNYPVTDTYRLEPSLLSPHAAIKRINAEWDALGHEPTMCEIVAFSPTATQEPPQQEPLIDGTA